VIALYERDLMGMSQLFAQLLSISRVKACLRLNLLALLMIICVNTIVFAKDVQTGSAVISHLNDNLLATMKNAKTLGYSGRYKMLDKVIGDTHDLAKIARFSVGRKNWGEMSEQQQIKFVDEFHRYSIATYVDRFNGFGGETFKTISEQSLPRGRVLVKSLLRSPEYGVVNFDYILDQDDAGKWKIINIMADGVSDLALKRAHYSDVIKQKGIDALIAELIEKTAKYTAKK
jgi:phospholipid transport system substrate-binding protein